jgi:ATP-dependent helicase HrpB
MLPQDDGATTGGPGPVDAVFYPVDEVLPALASALASGSSAVLVAPPGAGKTTRAPLALLDQPWLAGRRIILLEPRRIAARAAASRMADLLGERVGDTVGLRVRMETRVGPRTRIEVVTEGVFTRLILADPMLEGVGCVIFDEFHERSLDADLGLALALEAQSGLREDLRLLVMSATLDGARVAGLLGSAPVIRSEGRAFPVETRYGGRDPARRIEDDVVRAVRHVLAQEAGSILVFLPGGGEIRRVASLLTETLQDPNVDVAPLFGALGRIEQDLAIAPPRPGRRKVVLASALAETSLTIEGVRVVIDSGLARTPVFEPATGITRLTTTRVSRASADQRRGRAGRTGPGLCLRLWEEAATASLEPFGRPEILSADLAGLVLDCAEWGVGDPTALSFLDPLPAPALTEARRTLREIGALDEGGRLTMLGRRLGALPLPPRIAAMVLGGADRGDAAHAADLASLLVERGLGGDDVDLEGRLSRFRADGSRRAADMRRLADGWSRRAREGADPSGHAGEAASTGLLVALAFPDRIARARGRPGEYVLANGRGARVEAHLPIAREPYLAVAEVAGAAGAARILAAAAITPGEIVEVAGDRIVAADEVTFDPAAKALRARRTRRLGAVLLEDTPLPVSADEAAARRLARGLADTGLDALPWPDWSAGLRGRVAFVRASDLDGWPDLSDGALAGTAEDWLAPFLSGRTSLAEIRSSDIGAALDALVPFALRHRLEAEAPARFESPAGATHAIDYAAEGGPAVSVRVQELFGLGRHPTIGLARMPLVLHLLSPAGRAIQVTRDLPGFWRGSWREVRSQLRGRYPKHPWPEDPLAAPPTTRAKPRGT